MRDVVSLFVEASLAKGEWRAALIALQASPPITHSKGVPRQEQVALHHYTLSRALSQRGKWLAGLAVLRSVSSCLHQNPRQYSSAYLESRVRAYYDVLQRCCSPPAAGDVAADVLPSSVDADVLRGHSMRSFDRAYALVTEALHVLESPSTVSAEASLPSESFSSPSSVRTTPSAACVSAVEEMVRWCCLHWPHKGPCSSSSAVSDAKLLMTSESVAQTLAALASTALRHIVEAPAAPPKSEAEKETVIGSTAGVPPSSSVEVEKIKDELWRRLRSAERTPDGPGGILRLLRQLPAECVSPRLFTAIIRHLVKYRRKGEVVDLVHWYMLRRAHKDEEGQRDYGPALSSTPPSQDTVAPLLSDSAVLKVVAEACRQLKCPELAAELLQNSQARPSLVPSAAVPLVMTLRDAGYFATVAQWWHDLQKETGPLRYPLVEHAKLCSYVATCVLRYPAHHSGSNAAKLVPQNSDSGRHLRLLAPADATTTAEVQGGWQAALGVFGCARAPTVDPALVLLFQLRLLRQVRQWQAAVQLFEAYLAQHPQIVSLLPYNAPSAQRKRQGSRGAIFYDGGECENRGASPDARKPAVESAVAVLTEERAEQWIPPAILAHLRRATKS